MQKFSPEIEKFLNQLDGDLFAPKARKRQRRRTVTLSPEVYERLKDYAERHNQSMSEVANFKLDLSIPTPEDEAEIDALMAASKMQRQAFDDLFTVQPIRTYVN